MWLQLWSFLLDEQNRGVLAFIGGGAAVVIGGSWAVATFILQHNKDELPLLLARHNFELTQKLIATSLVQAAPGQEQAVGEAVKGVTQGAEAGDKHLRQALDLLKAGKAAEATPLLQAYATEKGSRIAQDSKDAATAWRNLGAIAGLHDPEKARESYAKAAALDPANVEGLSWNGWFQLDAKNLPAAEKSYRGLLRLEGKGADENQIFWARTGLGDIARVRGHLKTALAAYGEARSAMERLIQSDAGNAQWKYNFGINSERMGDVEMALGDLAAALKSYEAKRGIISDLAQSDAGNAVWQRDLSVSNNKIGDVLVKQHNLPEALKSYRSGLVIAERLAQSEAGNTWRQRDLSVSYERIGDVLVRQGNLEDALKSYRDSFAIKERLAKSDPGNPNRQHDLSVSYGKFGDTYTKQGKHKEALENYHQGLAIMERLAANDPSNLQWQADIIEYNYDIATNGEDSTRRFTFVAAQLKKLKVEHELTAEQVDWLAKSEAELKKRFQNEALTAMEKAQGSESSLGGG